MDSGLFTAVYPVQGVEVRPATVGDAIRMVPYVRDEDRDEVRAATGGTVVHALVEGIRVSDQAYVVLIDDEPAAIFGINPIQSADGILFGAIWLIGTNRIRRFARLFARESRTWVERLSQGYQVVGNVVDERNTVHIRWLKWLGFTFLNRITYGPERRPFLEFLKCVNPQQ